MPELWGQMYRKEELLARVGDMRQLAGVQAFELEEGNERGCRGVSLRNAAGLAFDVLLDRGMSLYNLSFYGVPLPFESASGPVHPAYIGSYGKEWVRNWPSGLSTPCGLDNVGSPCVDEGEDLGQHGRLASLPAKNVSYGGEWQGEDYVLWVQGSMRETSVMGYNLVLTRRIHTRLDSHRLWIEDRVENQDFEPAPLMFLQHFNLGFPLVDRTTRLELPPHTTEPRDKEARLGLESCCSFEDPSVGLAEQVFYHDLQPDARGSVEVRLVNPAFDGGRGLGLAIRYDRSQYPILVQWKLMRAGTYVAGLEPANCHVGGRAAERAAGTLQMIQPQETRAFQIEVEPF
jgi:hypothetical protein